MRRILADEIVSELHARLHHEGCHVLKGDAMGGKCFLKSLHLGEEILWVGGSNGILVLLAAARYRNLAAYHEGRTGG